MRLSQSQITVHTGLNPHYIPRKKRRAVLERDDEKCRFCQMETHYVCHNLPLCRGGRTQINNLLTCCRPCSRKKDQGTAKEFEEELKCCYKGSSEDLDDVHVHNPGRGVRIDLYLVAEVSQFLQRLLTNQDVPLKVRGKAERLEIKLNETPEDKARERKLDFTR